MGFPGSRRGRPGQRGADAELAAYPGPGRFDILNLLVATDTAVAQFGEDVRRPRPNLLLGDVPDRAEPTWAAGSGLSATR